MSEGRKSVNDILSTVVIAVFFAVILLLTVFGATGYQNAAGMSDSNASGRALLAYVATAVKDNQTADITIRDMDGISCLVIDDSRTGYERRIYVSEGTLLEEYGPEGSDLHPENAMRIGETELFELSFIEDGLLEIRTDRAASYVRTARQ